MYFDIPGLDQWVIAPPQAAVNYFTPFIRDFAKHHHAVDDEARQLSKEWKLLTQFGVLLPNLVHVLLQGHEDDAQRFMIKLMCQFSLICEVPVPNATEYLVPALLPPKPAHIQESTAMEGSTGCRFSLEFTAIPPHGVFEMLQAMVITKSSTLGSHFPPVVFKHIAVVNWTIHSLRLQQSHSSIVVDLLSGQTGAASVLAEFEKLLDTLCVELFPADAPWSVQLHGWDGQSVSQCRLVDCKRASREGHTSVACSNRDDRCALSLFRCWLSEPSALLPAVTSSSASINWVHAKLGAGLSSAYIGQDVSLLIDLFFEYWAPVLQAWVCQLPEARRERSKL